MSESKPVVMTQADYARHRQKSRQYISQLAKAGVLVVRNGTAHWGYQEAVGAPAPGTARAGPGQGLISSTASTALRGASSLCPGQQSDRKLLAEASRGFS